MNHILHYEGPFHICSSGLCNHYYQAKTRTGFTTTKQDLHVYTTHHHIAGILSEKYYFLFQGKYYEQDYGVPHQWHCSQPVYGKV